MNKQLIIDKIKDKSDNDIKIHHGGLFNLPLRMLVVGKSGLSGKTTVLLNMILKDEGYKNYFEPENIFIITPSSQTEKYKKLIEYLDIPEDNVFSEYDDEAMNELYEVLKEEHNESEEKVHKLFIIDDVGWSGELSSSGVSSNNFIEKVFCNGRHQLISCIVLLQKYTQASTCLRENASCFILWEMTNKQLELVEAENNNIVDKKTFMKAFKEATNKPRSFVSINYNKYGDERFTKGLYDKLFDNNKISS